MTIAEYPIILDDGTLDTVVGYQGYEFNFDSGYRFAYDSDHDFLLDIIDQLDSEIELIRDQENLENYS